jgi:hypothetical protein
MQQLLAHDALMGQELHHHHHHQQPAEHAAQQHPAKYMASHESATRTSRRCSLTETAAATVANQPECNQLCSSVTAAHHCLCSAQTRLVHSYGLLLPQ